MESRYNIQYEAQPTGDNIILLLLTSLNVAVECILSYRIVSFTRNRRFLVFIVALCVLTGLLRDAGLCVQSKGSISIYPNGVAAERK